MSRPLGSLPCGLPSVPYTDTDTDTINPMLSAARPHPCNGHADSSKRPEHGGRDRHFCIGVANLEALATKLDSAGIPFTRSMSGRAAVFFRDPDANCLECVELSPLTDRAGWSA